MHPSPSYSFHTYYVPVIVIEDVAVSKLCAQEVAVSVQDILENANGDPTYLHRANSVNFSHFDFDALQDASRHFLTTELDYCTIRTMNWDHAVHCSPFVQQLLVSNKTLRSLVLMNFEWSDISLSSLYPLTSTLTFDGPIIRSERLVDASHPNPIAKLFVNIRNSPATTMAESDYSPLLEPNVAPVGILYLNGQPSDLTAHYCVELQR